MKKLLAAALACAMALSLTACGGGGSSASTPNGSGSNEGEKLTFGYIAYDMSDIWNEYSARAFEYAAGQNGVKTVVLDSKNSLEESITAMESLIQQGVDGISIFPISTEQGAQLVKMANEANIPVTVENFAMDIENPGDYIASVACEYDKIGEAAIKWIAEQKEGAKIFFCAGQQGAGVYEKYQEGVDRAVEELNGKVEVVSVLHGDWLTDKAYNVTTDLINSGTEFDYIFANNDMMAQGCYNALKDAGKEGLPIVSTGGSPDGYQMLQDGVEAANMTAPVSLQGVKTFLNLYNQVALGQAPAEKFTALPVIPVSADDTSSYIAWDDYEAAYAFLQES
ncbi:MAG: sugar ABC transporter substrate-binding protein [Intestinimonas sp.]|uniref:sugar ABC transporter substrate-binding protein n=1 Tax=Intestinimonas sp. TaxID=1965293 RepID=UPI002A917247|nr:sugar ABC transporter substrate-binding protein [Intestinimonas sp.]MDY5340413.1 sugar ABC transporter substrate-binding protein [Intestinimonas sp.]